jgi:acyl carrier protein
MEGLLKLLVREKITLFSTGRIRDVVRRLDENRGFDSVRLVSFGGEVVHSRDVELYRKVFPTHCLIGVWFSSTETGNVTQFLMDRDTHIRGEIVPVGYPANDIEIILIDEAGGPVANGEAGEIAVKSRYLSPGYWRRPELTKERFLLDLHDRQKRIYLTGDIGRIDADGCLFYLGRKDDQVKIRGYRVEIAEIEAALHKLDSVQKAFVSVREKGVAEKALVAYVVPAQRQRPTTTYLKTALAETLPEYMIPSVFIMQEHLPLTTTGKVDRKALSDPGNSRPELETPFVAPRTSVEIQLMEIWGNVLCLDQIGVNDNFVDLGGHSLAAMRVVCQVIEKLQLEIPLASLFQAPTVAEMAAVIEAHQGKKVGEADLERMLVELESLSDDEARRLIAKESGKPSRGDQCD